MPQKSLGPTHSPSPTLLAATKNHSLTISSITGDYVYVVVQVTQDMHAVAYSDWKLPGNKFDLCVSDVTFAQFDKLAIELGRKVDTRRQKPTTHVQWSSLLRGSMLSFAELLSVSYETIG